ncbi:hypothetical protein ACKLNZ_12490 [Thermus scotoductus]
MTFSLSKSGLRVQPLPETPASFLARYRKEVYLVLTALALLSLVALYPKVVRRGKA